MNRRVLLVEARIECSHEAQARDAGCGRGRIQGLKEGKRALEKTRRKGVLRVLSCTNDALESSQVYHIIIIIHLSAVLVAAQR